MKSLLVRVALFISTIAKSGCAAVDIAEHHRDLAAERAGAVDAVQIHAQGVLGRVHVAEGADAHLAGVRSGWRG